jgi:hypothetical protein
MERDWDMARLLVRSGAWSPPEPDAEEGPEVPEEDGAEEEAAGEEVAGGEVAGGEVAGEAVPEQAALTPGG